MTTTTSTAPAFASLFDLSGKVAIVTGARTGLGKALAEALASAGADVVGLGSRPMPETARAVAAQGCSFHEVVCDLEKPQDFPALVADIVARAGGVDILVNNAGIIRRENVLDYTEADWDAVMTVNLKSLFQLSQAVGRHMVASGRPGRIVNIASLLSFQGGIRVPAYTAAKHGVAGLTKLMANELAPKGITVNAIAPGYMETDNTAALRADPERTRQLMDRIPAGRWGAPQDLATAVLFFAAPASGYVTGTVLPVDGGWMAR
ncbi:2-dehydro-3-deoxy-D-gluconate 5-dehydrogenase KduD [Chelatococcus daeguensis]|uniref:2-dehydro-3-deoxy-D-gluconate 5-dehydrogenase KduD n=1 Tax=Chelatococcus daeguensis TaxID=444444 RepID=UPI0007AB5060|nr:2-dehydro-3-deoxy-D-gluconate 5-dehydrogenase KduD [Chelatococcus daeguensis]KZE36749.1 2-deoxy-D-gluconate 3-dehydrogenase [Chelatococcus daeguensis]MBM3082385.1 2-dehydro-3-deoxy-D-gluconate 5-dehydrogenase KduD [Chelatococcus daeguensis]